MFLRASLCLYWINRKELFINLMHHWTTELHYSIIILDWHVFHVSTTFSFLREEIQKSCNNRLIMTLSPGQTRFYCFLENFPLAWAVQRHVQAAQSSPGLQPCYLDRFQNRWALSICWHTGHIDKDDYQILFKKEFANLQIVMLDAVFSFTPWVSSLIWSPILRAHLNEELDWNYLANWNNEHCCQHAQTLQWSTFITFGPTALSMSVGRGRFCIFTTF